MPNKFNVLSYLFANTNCYQFWIKKQEGWNEKCIIKRLRRTYGKDLIKNNSKTPPTLKQIGSLRMMVFVISIYCDLRIVLDDILKSIYMYKRKTDNDCLALAHNLARNFSSIPFLLLMAKLIRKHLEN